ncbi:MAG: CHAT domain-containing protein [Thermoanaerobaculia bacterium]
MKKRRQRTGLLNTSLRGLASLLLACGPASPPPEVEYSGCWTVSFPGPVCALWPGQPQLKLWVRADPGTEVEIRADGERLNATGEESRSGCRFKLSLSPETSSLTVRLRRPDGDLGPPWSLSLVPPIVPRWQVELAKLDTPGRNAEFRQRLADLREAVPRKERGSLLWLLAGQARIDGHDDQAAIWLRQGILVDRGTGLLSEEVNKATLLARIFMTDGRFADARQVLMDLRIPAGAPADARYLVAYYQGLLADRVGDYRSALENLGQASDLAERGKMVGHLLDSEQVRARILQELGRSREASELFSHLHATLLKETADSCDEGSLLTNEAWSRLLAREGGEEAEDPTAMLKRAQIFFDDRCARPDQRLNARLNLALADQQAHRWPAAREALTEAEAPSLASHATLDQRLWWLDLKGRQAIAEQNPRGALDLYDQLSTVAKGALSIEGGFRAAVGRAHAQLAMGRPAEATVSFQAADRLIDEQTWHIPVYEGRDTFVAQRELEMRRYLQLLLDRGLRRDAFELVRRDRSRLLRQLAVRDRLAHLTPAERQRWERSLSTYWTLRGQIDREAAKDDLLPGDELKRALESRAAQLDQARRGLDRAMAELGDPGDREESHPYPPSLGEVILAYHPLPKGWVGFAAGPEAIEVATFELPEDALAAPRTPRSLAALASSLTGPFQSVLERATRVRVLPFGRLRAIDFHALPWRGEPLVARLSVVYSLDLPVRPSPAPAGPRRALLVVDPEGDLPETRRESESVAETIGGWGQGWTLKRLDGSAANAGAVHEELPIADLFQFAGHGEFAGFGGWDSALRLAGGSRLTPGDLLALRRVPAWVVLSTCEGGRTSEEAPGEGIGLAQAFLLAGSRAVVATTRPVRDTVARDFAVELYRGWNPGVDLPQQFQRAQLACRRRNPAADWASFRLLEP